MKRTRAHGQLDLFPPPVAAAQPPMVGSVEVPAPVAAVAGQLPPGLYLGTSSWSFPGWQGLVYDRQASPSHLARHGLAAYAQHPLLRAVGLDRTYYAPLATTDFAAYAEAVPEHFRFVVKAHGLCTQAFLPHRSRERNPTFLDPGYVAEQVVGPCVEGLGRKTGVLLFQFPPQNLQILGGPQRFAERLHAFLAALPQGPCYAVELRNAALLVPAYVAALADLGVCHCYNVHPRMPTLRDQLHLVPLTSGPSLVMRWMLYSGLGYDTAKVRYQPFDRIVDPDPANRETIATMCLEAVGADCPAFVMANNHAEGSAPQTLLRLAELMVDRQSSPVRPVPCTSLT